MRYRDFPGGPVVKILLPLQGVRVHSLVRELRSCMPHSASKKKKRERERERQPLPSSRSQFNRRRNMQNSLPVVRNQLKKSTT